jgi:hypothetical protein
MLDKLLHNSTLYGWVTEEEDRKIKIKLWIGAFLYFTFKSAKLFLCVLGKASILQIRSSQVLEHLAVNAKVATVRRKPGQKRVTWKTPSSRAFVPLQEPVAVLASYVPHTQMPVRSNMSVVVHNLDFV